MVTWRGKVLYQTFNWCTKGGASSSKNLWIFTFIFHSSFFFFGKFFVVPSCFSRTHFKSHTPNRKLICSLTLSLPYTLILCFFKKRRSLKIYISSKTKMFSGSTWLLNVYGKWYGIKMVGEKFSWKQNNHCWIFDHYLWLAKSINDIWILGIWIICGIVEW